MELFRPIHQFEIRYTQIIDFQKIKSIVSPFVKLATKIRVDGEKTSNEKIYFLFEEDYYHFIVTWDRIIFRGEGLSNLDQNNSVIEEPFLNLYNRIKESGAYGETVNIVFYSYYFKVFPNKLEEIVQEFSRRNINETFLDKFGNNTIDAGIILDIPVENGKITMQTGPFVGYEDIAKRRFELSNPEIINKAGNSVGESFEFTYFEQIKQSFSFSKYKEISKIEKSYLNKIWNQQK